MFWGRGEGEKRAWDVFDGADGGQGGEQGSMEPLYKVQSETE